MRRSTPEHFWSRVKKGPGNACWEWQGSVQHRGHGHLTYQRQPWKAARLAYFLTYGEIPEGAFICHKCDNPPCCNPRHLYAGTPKSNTQDSIKAGTYGLRTPCGAQNPNSKLTAVQVREIRKLVARGVPRKEVASQYGIGVTNVGDIFNRKIWRHI